MDKFFNKIERVKKERIFTAEEIREAIATLVEASTFLTLRELSDQKGLCVYEVQVAGTKEGEYSNFMYIRKGDHGDKNESGDTSIHIAYYEDHIPVGGDKIAVYDEELDIWRDMRTKKKNPSLEEGQKENE
jgi:hypothetical protein